MIEFIIPSRFSKISSLVFFVFSSKEENEIAEVEKNTDGSSSLNEIVRLNNKHILIVGKRKLSRDYEIDILDRICRIIERDRQNIQERVQGDGDNE